MCVPRSAKNRFAHAVASSKKASIVRLTLSSNTGSQKTTPSSRALLHSIRRVLSTVHVGGECFAPCPFLQMGFLLLCAHRSSAAPRLVLRACKANNKKLARNLACHSVSPSCRPRRLANVATMQSKHAFASMSKVPRGVRVNWETR